MNRKYFIAQTDLQWLFIREWWIVENLVTSVLWNIFELRLIDNNSALNFKLEVFIPHTVIYTETNLSARNKTKWASAACCSSLQSLFSNSFMHRVCQYFEILPKWQNKKMAICIRYGMEKLLQKRLIDDLCSIFKDEWTQNQITPKMALWESNFSDTRHLYEKWPKDLPNRSKIATS